MAEQTQVEIKDKFCLTIDEASAYFNIGEKKLSRIVTDNIDERANVKTDGMRSNTLMPQAAICLQLETGKDGQDAARQTG